MPKYEPTEAQKQLLVNEGFKVIVNSCKLEGIDFYSLDPKMKALLVTVFQGGLEYALQKAIEVNKGGDK